MDDISAADFQLAVRSQMCKVKVSEDLYKIDYKHYKRMIGFYDDCPFKFIPDNFLFKAYPDPDIPDDLTEFSFNTLGRLFINKTLKDVTLIVTKGGA